MRGKGGISAIVATVLTILITVAAVAIVWLAIVPMINENIAFEGLDGRVTIVTTRGYTVYDEDENVAIVQVRRDVDEGTMDRIKVSFLIEGETVSSNVVAPESGQTKTYAFDLSEYGEPEGIEVAPIFIRGEQEKEGSVTSRVDMPSGDIIEDVNSVEFKAKTYNLGEDYYGDYSEIPTDGLISWWRFSGDFNDSVGGNDGSEYNGASVIDDVLVLDGSNDYVAMGDIGIPLNGPATISGWFNFKDTAGSRANSMNLYSSILYQHGTNNEFYIPGAEYFLNSRLAINLNEWSHLILTYNGNGSTAKLYVDSNLYHVNVQSGAVDMGALDDFNVGSSSSSFDGSIDNVMIFDRVLSQDEMTAIYENQRKS